MTDTANMTRDPERRRPGPPLVDVDLAEVGHSVSKHECLVRRLR